MQKDPKLISGIAAAIGEGALQLSGYTSIPLAIGLGCAAVGLLMWAFWPSIRRRMKEEEKVDNEKQPYIHVESHAQQGGITAYQVNIEPGDRKLSTRAAQQLKNYLDKTDFKMIEVNAIMGDAEAFRFASQVKNYLVSEGFEIKGVNQVIYAEPIQGQVIESPNSAGLVKIIIGSR